MAASEAEEARVAAHEWAVLWACPLSLSLRTVAARSLCPFQLINIYNPFNISNWIWYLSKNNQIITELPCNFLYLFHSLPLQEGQVALSPLNSVPIIFQCSIHFSWNLWPHCRVLILLAVMNSKQIAHWVLNYKLALPSIPSWSEIYFIFSA